MSKYLIECSKDGGSWNKFNYFKGSELEVRNYLSTIIMKTNYDSYRFTLVEGLI
jgi:hypothetical protein